jgi:diguanylate cyclase (GGDEF)-like protein/PAS domain S-box-containing protein
MAETELSPQAEPLLPLRVLFVEDNPDDVQLSLLELRRANVAIVSDVARTKDEFLERISASSYDAVIADYSLGGWTGMDALAVMKEKGKDLPFILVTGVLGDGVAVDCIKQGVSDYVLKDRLARLPAAVRTSIKEARLQKERKNADDKLQESEKMFRTLAESIDSAIFVYLGTTCRYANREAEVITGYTRAELVSMNSLNLIHRDSRRTVVEMGFSNGPVDGAPQHFEVKINTKSGEGRWLDMTSSIIDIEGKRGRLVAAFDITERKAQLQDMERLATIDALTGLSNYRRLLDAFDSERSRSQRTGRPFSLLLLDLDKLKNINDTYGHSAGSRSICRVGDILQAQCRSMDTAARYGGDEFAVLLPETKGLAARHLADRIADTVLKDDERPPISVSFGLATCPEDGVTFNEVFQIADSRLYLMKDRPLRRSIADMSVPVAS